MSEADIDSIILQRLKETGFNKEFVIGQQNTKNSKINELLSTASKNLTGSKGFPDFILHQKDGRENLVFIIETKEGFKHESEKNDKSAIKEYAVNGVKHYANFLRNDYNVVALGISGIDENLTISSFFYAKGETGYSIIPIDFISKPKFYYGLLKNDPQAQWKKTKDLYKTAEDLSKELRNKLKKDELPLVVSGILLALKDDFFRNSLNEQRKPKRLAKGLYDAIKNTLEDSGIPDEKRAILIETYKFINTKASLVDEEIIRGNKIEKNTTLRTVINLIYDEVYPFYQIHRDYDVLGIFYEHFLKRIGSDGKGLGIVLTPKHIAELMIDLVQVDKNTVLLDTCTGSGQFLISGMEKMLNEAIGDENKQKEILSKQLIGVEYQDFTYTLASSNMMLRGDGKSQLYKGDCFSYSEEIKSHNPTAGAINPPYSQGDGLHELNFIEHMLDSLEKNSLGAAIVPMGIALKKHPLKKKIMQKHTLVAVMSMPNELFGRNASVVSCIMVFKAGVKHNPLVSTWFGYWKNDGFVRDKILGRADRKGEWKDIKNEWLNMYNNRVEKPGISVLQSVEHDSQWCAEAYLETDFTQTKGSDFEEEVLKYLSFKKYHERGLRPRFEEFRISEWKSFKYKDIFDIEGGKGVCVDINEESDEKIPWISATEKNNGMSAYTYDSYKHPGGTITVSKNGSIGEAFYQAQNFCASSDVAVLLPKFKINEHIALFLASMIRKEKFKYNYGRKWNIDAMKDTDILLPVDENNEPHWAYMEEYIKELTADKM
ncbi:MAG: N-6 DNA methylase [Bacillota bacterium]